MLASVSELCSGILVVSEPIQEDPVAEIKVDELAGEVAKVLRDALYISVGLGVLAVQKVQEQRRELAKRFEAQLDTGRDQMASFRSNVEQQLKYLMGRTKTAA